MIVCVWLKSSDDEADSRLNIKQETNEDKEQDAGATAANRRATSTCVTRSTRTKAAQNEHSSHSRNNDDCSRSALTVVQDAAAQSSDDNSAGSRRKRQKTSKKWKVIYVRTKFHNVVNEICCFVAKDFCF